MGSARPVAGKDYRHKSTVGSIISSSRGSAGLSGSSGNAGIRRSRCSRLDAQDLLTNSPPSCHDELLPPQKPFSWNRI